ncbi:B-4DMT family transporter [Mycobacterium lacus]|uniref:Uncharacterized protein n=1 Tax=Mycobacterium lacus TaxID=169765 RepID=A0A1X1Y7Y2_9MYCO|nr:B-4DMT family transporter [Mycobacterium lacus]MCV7123807.1 B-4DMT family transporter [Mycobacterium lacus]ORW07232.1 hypothetical protein AWC15_20525 [Mycobacterium lacus]BBX95915.1 hypothetical protein MLAC_12090 [Mycobacterium lacus]
MTNWMLRGLAFAAAMVVVRLFQGALINAWQTQAGLISVVLLLIFVLGVIVWGVLDGRADASANPDPDRRQDLAMTWLLAGLVAGAISGAVSLLISLFYKGIYVGGLINELTTFAAFTALVVFLPAIVGVSIGRWQVDRQLAKVPVRHHGLAAEHERADTDVFTAVRGGEAAAAQHEERTAAVATAEREATTETIPTAEPEAPTEVIRTTDAEQTKPDTPKKD